MSAARAGGIPQRLRHRIQPGSANRTDRVHRRNRAHGPATYISEVSMNQSERRKFLINYLINEKPRYSGLRVPDETAEQKKLLRSLMNVRPPAPCGEEFLKVQDEYLRAEAEAEGITDISDLTPVKEGIYLWQGDITTLRCGAIVNAANSGMTGCYIPCHGCIDNAIHTYAGVRLRQECARQMQKQGHEEETGKAKITPAYNLPCDYILHTVGPVIRGEVTGRDRELLASCYCSCLELARQNKIESVAFCCISTGEFRFPQGQAAEIAVRTVMENRGDIKVVFNVFKESDYRIYRELLG